MKFSAAVLFLPAAAMAKDTSLVGPGYERQLQGGPCSELGFGVDKMAICHGTASASNPYTFNCVDNDSTCDSESGCAECAPGTLIEACCAASGSDRAARRLGEVERVLQGGTNNDLCGGHGAASHNSENTARYDDIILAFNAADLAGDVRIPVECTMPGMTNCYLDAGCNINGDNEDDDGGMMGDPHVKTFVGEWFDYSGECDLVLAAVEKFDGHQDLNIHARTTIRYDYSFIEAAAIQIGKDVLEVDSFGAYALNDVDGAEQTWGGRVPKLGGYPVYKTLLNQAQQKHRFDIVIDETQNITVSNMKDIVSVTISHVRNQRWENVVGLMGHANGNLVARDGVTDMHDDIDNFAGEWQVQPSDPQLFRTLRAPQWPQKCILPDANAKEARRLGEGITEAAAAEACKRFSGAALAACIYDVTATNDLDQADAGVH